MQTTRLDRTRMPAWYLVWCTKVGSLADVVGVINKSAECNFAQLVSGTTVALTQLVGLVCHTNEESS